MGEVGEKQRERGRERDSDENAERGLMRVPRRRLVSVCSVCVLSSQLFFSSSSSSLFLFYYPLTVLFCFSTVVVFVVSRRSLFACLLVLATCPSFFTPRGKTKEAGTAGEAADEPVRRLWGSASSTSRTCSGQTPDNSRPASASSTPRANTARGEPYVQLITLFHFFSCLFISAVFAVLYVLVVVTYFVSVVTANDKTTFIHIYTLPRLRLLS